MSRTTVPFLLAVFLTACGDGRMPGESSAEPPVDGGVPAWAHVAPEQLAAAEEHGVPVAFENELGMRFVLIPAGRFRMGSPPGEAGRDWDEVEQDVRISRPFYLQTTEVTNACFRGWKPDHDSDFRTWRFTLNEDDQPVHADWRDVQGFVRWMSSQDPLRTYRLPTEAEWEYACRARATTPWYWGASFDDAHRYENCNGVEEPRGYDPGSCTLDDPDGYVTTAPVGSYLPNPWGLHDMLGNMDEWCLDGYVEVPWSSPTQAPIEVDPTGPISADEHVVRSSFCLAETSYARCAGRYGLHRNGHLAVAGLRLVCPLPAAGDAKEEASGQEAQ